MTKEERISLIAPCGLDCGICELYISKDNHQLLEQLISMGIPKDKIPCNGCRSIEGQCPAMGGSCPTYNCVNDKGHKYCFDCNEFPCVKIQPAAERAQTLPHNMKVFNLCEIKNRGPQSFVENSINIKNRYFRGKMVLGEGPVC